MEPVQITFVIGVFMLVSYMLGKIPYGMTAIFCCLALDITGVLTPAEAWGGFGDKTVFLFASVFILGAGLMKTDFISQIQTCINRIGNKDSKVRWICMAFAAVLSMLTSATSSGATMIPMMSALCEGGNYRKSTVYKPVIDVACMSFAMMPFGMGAAFIEQGNSYLAIEGSAVRLNTFDSAIVRFPVMLLTMLFVGLIAYRFIPERKGAYSENEKASVSGECELSPLQNKLGKLIFFISIAAMILSSLLGIPSHYAPIAGSLAMVASGVLSGPQAFRAVDLNTVCIFGGSLSFSTAMVKTGIADWIADALIQITSQNLNESLLVAIFLLVPFVMTQFMGNIPVINLTMPIAAAVAINSGMNPTAIMVATIAGATLSIATPMAAGVQALIMEPAGYKFADYLRAGLPTAFVYTILYVLWAPIIYPLY